MLTIARPIGQSTPLNRAQSAELAAVLTPADGEHPWPERIGTDAFGGGRLSVPMLRVKPTKVAEVSADAALNAEVFRHPLRLDASRPRARGRAHHL